MTLNTENLKAKLLEEKETLESELSRIARKDPENPSNWEAVSPALGEDREADENLAADNIEDYEENVAITSSLEARYNDVKTALENIDQGKYGLCHVCGTEIEGDRLEANPAARTCKEHINIA